jgi:DNA replication and repair protein RecF
MPEDIQIITGSPSERRKYMDAILVQVDSGYKRSLNTYIKVVRQRNKILEKICKEGRGWDEIEYWTDQLLRSGKILQEKRETMFEIIQGYLEKNAKILNNGKTEAFIKYKKNDLNRERLEKYRDREIASKSTLIGPHRDDFEILFNGHSVAEFGSRGQQRSMILALKLSEIEFIEKEKGERPILLLDDIFSELDEKHQEAVLDVIENQQTIITSTEKLGFIKTEAETIYLS